jgi:hypothetical protein
MNPGNCKSSNLNQSQILEAMQVYYPGATAASLQAALSVVDNQSAATVQGIINSMQSGGVLPYINQAINLAKGVYTSPSTSVVAKMSVKESPDFMPPPPPKNEGGGPTACAIDGAALLAMGTVFFTLSIMTLGSVDVLAGAAWGAIALWGGIGTGAWTLGHAAACGF